MTPFFKNTNRFRLLWGILALYILNISVDARDIRPFYVNEDLSFNDQESIVEILIEKVLGFENAIAEYDDNDSEEFSKKSNLNIKFITLLDFNNAEYIPKLITAKNVFPSYNFLLLNGFNRFETPPPRV